MTFRTTDLIGGLKINETILSTGLQEFPLGTIIEAVDPVFGVGEFIFLKGVASTAVGDLVIYDTKAATTVRTVAGSRGPCAIAMSANLANQFGWYQISGQSVVKTAAAVVSGANGYVTATAGAVDDAVVATDKIDGLRFKSADGTQTLHDGTTLASSALVQLNRPSLNGNG